MDLAHPDSSPVPLRAPQRASGAADLSRPGGQDAGEPTVVLRPSHAAGPAARPAARVVGPGRKERAYLRRVAGLEEQLVGDGERLERLGRELEVAQSIERGTGRLVDRMESQATLQRKELAGVRSQGHRLMVTLGALQQENEGLRAQLASARERLARLSAPERSWWRRVLGG